MKTSEELDEYLAGIRKTIAEGEALVEAAQLRMAETDRFLATQGLSREQVLANAIHAAEYAKLSAADQTHLIGLYAPAKSNPVWLINRRSPYAPRTGAILYLR